MNKIKQALIDKQADRALGDLMQGDMNGLSVVYDLYGRLILSVAYTIVGNFADAEDVLQDVLLLLARYAKLYKPGKSPRAYVASITRHTAINLINKRKNNLSPDEIGDLPSHDGKLASVEVQELLAQLSEEERQVVTLHVYAGLPHRQIAQMLEISRSAAEKKYQRALKKLKKYYES